jgi:hypothetical protein
MRYTAIVALAAALALLGCKNLQSSRSGAQPGAAQQSSTIAPGAAGASPAIANTTAATPTPPQPASSATGQAGITPAQPAVKDNSETAPPQAKASSSQTPQPKSSDGTSMPPTRRNSGNTPTGTPGAAAGAGGARAADAKGATQPSANNSPPGAQRPSAPPPPTLDLNSLKDRLKDTRAIGLFTKLSLKNQVDDLLSQLRAFHAKKSTTSLPELRQRYDLLLLKVLSLLQDGDPPLATAISQSRDSIWGILSDPQQFAKL